MATYEVTLTYKDTYLDIGTSLNATMMLSPLRYRLLSSAFTSKAINTLTTHWSKCYGTATTKSASYNIVQPGKVSKSCLVPNTISKPKYVTHTHVPSYPVELLKHEADIEVFRHAGVIAFAILKYAGIFHNKNSASIQNIRKSP